MPTTFSAGQYLTAAQLTALAAQAAAGGEYSDIDTLTGTQADITFSSIPTTLREIELNWTARSDDAGFVAHGIAFQINSITSSAYWTQYDQANNTTLTAAPTNTTFANVGLMPNSTAAAGNYGSGKISFTGWNGAHSTNLGYRFQSAMYDTGTAAWVQTGGGVFRSAGPWTSIRLFPALGSFASGTQAHLIGRY